MKNLPNIVLFVVMAIFANFAQANANYAIFPTTSSDNSVNFIECQFAQVTKQFYIPYYGSCSAQGINNPASGTVASGTIAATENRFDVYFVNTGTNNFSKCQLDAFGRVKSGYCQTITPSGVGTIINPTDIQINGNYAYIIGQSQNHMGALTQCRYNFLAGIEVTSCVTSELTFYAGHILFNNNVAYIYAGNGVVNQCNVTSNGIDISSCQQSTIASSGETLTGADTYNGSIYFVASPSNIIMCSLTASNNIDTNSCHDYLQEIGGVADLNFYGATVINADNSSSVPILLTGSDGGGTFNLCSLDDISIIGHQSCEQFMGQDDGVYLPYHGYGVLVH